MILCKAFRSSHTVRITLNQAIRNALSIQPGHHLVFQHTAPGVMTVRNADALLAAPTAKKKPK